jgi:16S rRNA (uracil1498-N3)-methyltransferase
LHHLRDFLRLKKDAPIGLLDGKGGEAEGKLMDVTSRRAQVRILSVQRSVRKKPLLILACALPKKSKFEFIIEKATELGADEIIPLLTKRTEIDLTETRLHRKHLRFQTVAVNAAKQSQRAFLPVIHPVTPFEEALASLTAKTVAVIPSLDGEHPGILTVLKTLKSPAAVSFFIGPEGDFTPAEYTQARASGCLAVTLGKTVLKVETAALCALSCAGVFFHA